MEVKLCRICGKQGDSHLNIFRTDGLKNKIETCLPIVVIENCPLPDTICTTCRDSVDNFYSFIKSCLQNIIVLEAQYELIESCLKTKRKVDRAVSVDPCELTIVAIPTLDDCADAKLVDYECSSSDSENGDDNNGPQQTNNIIDEIVQRKSLLKRKYDEPLVVSLRPAKQARYEPPVDTTNRRKNSRPKRVEYHLGTQQDTFEEPVVVVPPVPRLSVSLSAPPQQQQQKQTCLLCEQQLPGLLALAAHMFATHGIDLTQVYGGPVSLTALPPTPPSASAAVKSRKIPELVKISDVLNSRRYQTHSETSTSVNDEMPAVLEAPAEPPQPRLSEQPQQLFVCTECPTGRQRPFASFSDFSTHRRAQHQIFHCDLCPKFYGRNSHLWKHVNRVHKGHAAITCHECGKTSASEYHLAQHRNKMHSAQLGGHTTSVKKAAHKKNDETLQEVAVVEIENHQNVEDTNDDTTNDDEITTIDDPEDEDDLLNQKFQGFDFKSVRQSFLRQELMNKRQRYVSVLKKNNVFDDLVDEDLDKKAIVNSAAEKTNDKSSIPAPKEIDSSSDLYTTIITNYTPPSNEGPYKCPKCFKGFHKKNLLKKHKKNCRPRLQKDLLTRCKTCSRIFKDRQSLAKHLVNYHSEYTCEICAVAVQSKCEIVSHIRFTHPGCELQCYCGQILRSRGDLARHKSDHRDSHVCQFCGDALPTKIKLKMHILSLHRKILALSCGICLRLFESQHVLRAHVRHAHADQLRPLTSCTVCGKNYGSKWKTYDHLNKSHGRIFRACKACLEVFESDKELQLHVERDHGNNSNTTTLTVNNTVKSKNSQKQQLKSNKIEREEDLQLQTSSVVEEEDPDDLGGEYQSFEFAKRNGVATSSSSSSSAANNNNKLSLLEKRLLGKKAPGDHQHQDEDPDTAAKEDQFENLASSTDDILQNSSKRTVYVNSNDPSLCEICLKVWPAKKHLWQHYIRCHKQTAATVCGICLKTNPTYASLQQHLQDTHPRLLHGCGFGSNFICKICGRYHNASSKLRLHMAIHVGFSETTLQDKKSTSSSTTLQVDKTSGKQLEQQEQQQQQKTTSTTSKKNKNNNSGSKGELLAAVKQEHSDDDEEDDDEDDEVEDEEEDDENDTLNVKVEEDYEEQEVKHEASNESDEEDDDDDDDEEEEDEEDDDDDDDEDDEDEENIVEQSVEEKTVTVKRELIEEDDADGEEDDEENAEINYESLIEEVEASDVDSESDEEETERDIRKNSNSTTTTKTSSSTNSSSEDVEHDMEQEMLKNMIGESRSVRLLRIKQENESENESDDAREENGLHDDDDDDDEDEEEGTLAAYEVEVIDEDDDDKLEVVKHELGSDEDEYDEEGQWIEEPERTVDELNSAIRSICDEDLEEIDDEDDDEEDDDEEMGEAPAVEPPTDSYRRLVVTGGRVNESELETAVGSIL